MQHKFYMVGHQYMYTCTRPNDNDTSFLIPALLTRVKSDVQLVIYNALVNLVACVGLWEDPWKIQIYQIPIVRFQIIDNDHPPPPGGKIFWIHTWLVLRTDSVLILPLPGWCAESKEFEYG